MSKLYDDTRKNILDMENIAYEAAHKAEGLIDKVNMRKLEKKLRVINRELRLMLFEFEAAEGFAGLDNT